MRSVDWVCLSLPWASGPLARAPLFVGEGGGGGGGGGPRSWLPTFMHAYLDQKEKN